MYRPAQFAGYLALISTAGALLVGSLLAPVEMPSGTVGVRIGIVLTAAVAGIVEHRRELVQLETPGFARSDGIDALAVVTGAAVTYALSVHVGLGPVVASALIGLLVGLAAPKVGVPVYCGSFVGMASPAVFASLEYVAVAGLVAGLGFAATTESFGGVGGKLGTLALFGCLTTAAVVGLEFTGASAPRWGLASVVVPVAIVAAVATAVLSVRLELGAVIGSGLVGLVAGVAFPLAVPELGATLAAAAFCASFVGMSSTERLAGVPHVAVAGGLSGLVFLAVAPAFDGAGGKLGTVAFVSCIGLIGTLELHRTVVERVR
ncbi:hypothetical protein [Natronorubrum sp. FCH18a]|uniref:hypothetical protein n=1 Tax=Natronorubrum sp. FCH18a TaxID=3447018 RepID=UPI003F51536A